MKTPVIQNGCLGAADRQELIQTRRDLHQHPELAFEEHRTAALIERHLESLGLPPRTGIAGTGVTATLTGEGGTGRCLALRADMDALPVQEVAGRPHGSTVDGVMHACGHDGHVASLLAALRVLSRERAGLAGAIRAIFQPAEEVGDGAARMIREGALQDPRVDAAVGLHYWGFQPTGVIGVKAGPSMASVDEFRLTIHGKGGHGAIPHEAVDALAAGAYLVTALQTLVSRAIDPLQPAVVTVGEFRAGDAFNVIAGEARLSGTIRTFDRDLWREMPGRFEELTRGVCAAHGCGCDIEYNRHTSPLNNDPQMAELVREVAVELVGEERVVEQMTMGGEDMAEFLSAVPGCFFFVGAASEAKGITAGQHHPAFDLDEDALEIGVEMLVRVARRYLQQ